MAFEKAIDDIFNDRLGNNFMDRALHEPEVDLEGVHERYVHVKVMFSPRLRSESTLTICRRVADHMTANMISPQQPILALHSENWTLLLCESNCFLASK